MISATAVVVVVVTWSGEVATKQRCKIRALHGSRAGGRGEGCTYVHHELPPCWSEATRAAVAPGWARSRQACQGLPCRSEPGEAAAAAAARHWQKGPLQRRGTISSSWSSIPRAPTLSQLPRCPCGDCRPVVASSAKRLRNVDRLIGTEVRAVSAVSAWCDTSTRVWDMFGENYEMYTS